MADGQHTEPDAALAILQDLTRELSYSKTTAERQAIKEQISELKQYVQL